MRRIVSLLVLGTLVAAALASAPHAGAGGDAQIEAEPPSLEDTIDLALADIDEFWTKNIKRAYRGLRYEPIETLAPYDSTNFAQVAGCGAYQPQSYDEVAQNAFYCPAEEKIVWDIEGWFPDLYSNISYLAVVEILAHEWGHAIQDQGGLPADAPSILKEQQADCFGGVYVRYLADGKSKRFQVTDDDIQTMVSSMLEARDAVGSPTTNPSAHGSAFDRINAMQEGFDHGPGRCARFEDDPPNTLDLEFGEDEVVTGGNLDLETITADVQKDLDDFWEHTLTKYRPVPLVVAYDPDTIERLPQCGNLHEKRAAFRNTIFYCPEGDFVAWDVNVLADAHEAYGDFAVATLIAQQWSRHVAEQLGAPISGEAGDQHVICLTGAYAGDLYKKTRPSRLLELSAGDLDEAVQVQLYYTSGSGKERNRSAFVKVDALRLGFSDGADACAQLLPKKARR